MEEVFSTDGYSYLFHDTTLKHKAYITIVINTAVLCRPLDPISIEQGRNF